MGFTILARIIHGVKARPVPQAQVGAPPLWSSFGGYFYGEYELAGEFWENSPLDEFVVAAGSATSYSIVEGTLPTGWTYDTTRSIFDGMIPSVGPADGFVQFTLRATNAHGSSDKKIRIDFINER